MYEDRIPCRGKPVVSAPPGTEAASVSATPVASQPHCPSWVFAGIGPSASRGAELRQGEGVRLWSFYSGYNAYHPIMLCFASDCRLYYPLGTHKAGSGQVLSQVDGGWGRGATEPFYLKLLGSPQGPLFLTDPELSVSVGDHSHWLLRLTITLRILFAFCTFWLFPTT